VPVISIGKRFVISVNVRIELQPREKRIVDGKVFQLLLVVVSE